MDLFCLWKSLRVVHIICTSRSMCPIFTWWYITAGGGGGGGRYKSRKNPEHFSGFHFLNCFLNFQLFSKTNIKNKNQTNNTTLKCISTYSANYRKQRKQFMWDIKAKRTTIKTQQSQTRTMKNTNLGNLHEVTLTQLKKAQRIFEADSQESVHPPPPR